MSQYTVPIRVLADDSCEALELADCGPSGGFADELSDHFGYGRPDDFTPEEEQEMFELFGRPRAADDDSGPDRRPPAGAHPVRLAA